MKFFSLDSPLMRFLNKMTDVLWLNILTLILCVPIITAGAAFTSLHYVCLKLARDEEGYITREYFKSFKRNFKQSTIIWLIALVLIVILYLDFNFIQYTSHPAFMTASICAASIFLYCTLLYVFPVLSHFENTIKGTVKNSFYMSILALPRTVLMVAVTLLPVGIVYLVEKAQTMYWLIPLAFLFWFSAPAYLNAKIYDKIFKRFEPAKEEENDDFTWSVNSDVDTLETEEVTKEESTEEAGE